MTTEKGLEFSLFYKVKICKQLINKHISKYNNTEEGVLAGAYSVHFLGENFQVRLLVFLVTRIIISGIAKKDSYLWLAVFLRVFQSLFFVLCDGRMLIVRRAVDFAAKWHFDQAVDRFFSKLSRVFCSVSCRRASSMICSVLC